jgi:hypothetical protein
MYYEPIEDGDVRMISLNYVKADEQSVYQIGQQDQTNNKTGFLLLTVRKGVKESGKQDL